MNSEVNLEAELETVTRKWRELIDVPERPRSLMNVIEYSLGRQQRAEVYVNRLLRYLLDPEEPHGMEDEFLDAFLSGLPEACAFQEDVRDLSATSVDDQVLITGATGVGESGTERRGDVDLVIEESGEWVLLIELKFAAGENNLRGDGRSQTEFYRQASQIDGRSKTEYESDAYYLYVHPGDEASARDSEFVDWTWEALVDDIVEPFIVKSGPRYPQRTVTQLHDLVDDVREITGMTDHQRANQEKIELYLDHYDAITDVSDAFETRWTAFADEWPDELVATLESDGIDTEPWTFYAKDSDWGHLFRDGWWRDTRELQPIDRRDENSEDVRISFIHRLERNRDLAIGDRTLKFYFRSCGSNDAEFRDEFNRRFQDPTYKIATHLPDAAEFTGERRNLLVATYDIDVASNGDFFDAYVTALKHAFIDHAVDNEGLIEAIEQAFTDSIERYR